MVGGLVDGSEQLCLFILGSQQSQVYTMSDVFHGLTKHTVVHQLEEIFLKVGGGVGAQLRVQVDVRAHPGGLLEGQHAVHTSNDHA